MSVLVSRARLGAPVSTDNTDNIDNTDNSSDTLVDQCFDSDSDSDSESESDGIYGPSMVQ